MTGDTVECFNCGRANPSWAQVCRSCGVPIRAGTVRTQPTGPIPTDRDSLLSIGAGLGAIVLAIVVGVFLSGIIPEAALVPLSTPTPEASVTPIPSASFVPSGAPSTAPTAVPTPALPGTVSFGLGLNQSTREAIDLTDTFTSGTSFCHSISMSEPFGVAQIQEEVLKVAEDGSLTVIQERQGSNLTVNPNGQIAGFCVSANPLIRGWGEGNFVLRDYRNNETPELIAEGRFTLAR
jgi:hypothetical protein